MAEFIKIAENNLLIIFPVIKYDINIAEDICGANLVSLKVKTVIQQPIQLRDSVLPMPLLIFHKYKQITLCVDVMKVNTVLSSFLFLFYRLLWPYSMLVIGWWSSKTRTESIGT